MPTEQTGIQDQEKDFTTTRQGGIGRSYKKRIRGRSFRTMGKPDTDAAYSFDPLDVMQDAAELRRKWTLEYEPLLREAINISGEEDTEDVYNKIINGLYNCYLVTKDGKLFGIYVISGKEYNNYRAIVLLYMAGEKLKLWGPGMIEQILQLGRQLGYQRAEAITSEIIARLAIQRFDFKVANFITKEILPEYLKG